MKKSYFLCAAAILAAAASCPSTANAETTDSEAVSINNLAPKTTQEIWGEGDSSQWQEKWLTMPNSRLVLNHDVGKSNSSLPFSPSYIGPEKSTDYTAAFTISDTPLGLQDTGSNPSDIKKVTKEFSMNGDVWSREGGSDDSTVAFGDNELVLTVAKGSDWMVADTDYSSMSINQNAELTVHFNSIKNGTAEVKAKLDDGAAGSDVKLLEGITKEGDYKINLANTIGGEAIGFHKIKFYVSAVGSEAQVKVGGMSVTTEENSKVKDMFATDESISWRPDYTSFSANYVSGMKVSGHDYFYDVDTTVREIAKNDKGSLYLSGDLKSNVNADSQSIVMTDENSKSAVAFSVQPTSINYYKNQQDMLNNAGASAQPIDNGVFLAEFPDGESQPVYVTYSMKEPAVSDEAMKQDVMAPIAAGDVAQAKEKRTQEEDDFYAKVPVPSMKDISVGGRTTKKEDIEKQYYKAWDLMNSSVYPESAEIGYDYPQFATSKATRWGNGAPKSRWTAAWEGFYNCQYYSYIDPETSWKAFKGLISQVSEDGSLAGEGLPVNRARTAMIMYNNTKDKKTALDNLNEVYQNIDKNLVFAFNNPRWFFPNSGRPDNQKDTDFLAAALVDVPYMEKIYSLLQDNGYITNGADKIAEWEHTRETQLANYENWFFKDGNAYEWANIQSDGTVTDLENTWPTYTTKGFHIPELSKDKYDSIHQYFTSLYDPAKDDAGLGIVKYEELAYTAYGLYEHGENELANELLDTSIRDIVGGHYMCEQLEPSDDNSGSKTGGVYCSVFGASQMIDSLWMRNNMRYDSGDITVYGYNDAEGGVNNIHSGSDIYGFAYKGNKATIYKNGAAAKTVTLDKTKGTGLQDTATVKKITLKQTGIQILKQGKTMDIKAAAEPAEADTTKLIWKVTNSDVAAVDAAGKLTALKPGITKVTVMADNGVKDSFTLRVTQ